MERSSGILLHITSLPSNYGIGDLGPAAYKFIDLLEEGKQKYWQVLPLNPVDSGGSPYSPGSVFAGNTLLISPELLSSGGFISETPPPQINVGISGDAVDYGRATEFKNEILSKAYSHSMESARKEERFLKFCEENSNWLEDYALFISLSLESGNPWHRWPAELRDRNPATIKEKRARLATPIERVKFEQYLFYLQWSSLKEYCASKRISIAGDLPFYASYDSSDMWSHPDLFKLDRESKKPIFVGGVPPDYFSKTGQLWGNPVYDWEKMKEENFQWWIERISHNMKLFDLLRFDHFRGYVAYWEVPAGEKTAINGKWTKASSESFFQTIKARFPSLPFFAEDLGEITQDVKDTLRDLGIPGTKVLVFGFNGEKDNTHLPYNYYNARCVVCTGTHDTNTTRGWYMHEASKESKDEVSSYIGKPVDEENVSWEFIRLAVSSTAELSLTPAQDLLSLGPDARMNNPATCENNWRWRLKPDQLKVYTLHKLRELTETFGRA